MFRIGIRVDGDAEIGLGHVFQQVQLARYLMETQDADINLFTRSSIRSIFISKNYPEFNWHFLPQDTAQIDSLEFLRVFSMKESLDLVIFDITDPYPNLKEDKNFYQVIDDIKKCGTRTLGMEYISTEEYNANTVVNPSIVKQRQEYSRREDVDYYLGPDYFILAPVYKKLNEQKRMISDAVSRIFICMGGSDKNNVTGKVLNHIIDLNLGIKIDIILGPKHVFLKEFRGSRVSYSDDITIYDVSWNIWEHMMNCDLAITSAGRLPYELAATGTPSISIPIVEHQEQTADAFQELGTTVKMPSSFLNNEFRDTIQKVTYDKDLRKRMSLLGKRIVDGRSLGRISEVIKKLIG